MPPDSDRSQTICTPNIDARLLAYHHYRIDALTGDPGTYLMISMKTTPQTPDAHGESRNGALLFRPLAEVPSICYKGRV